MDSSNPVHGNFPIKMDKRGRVVIPATFRASLHGRVLVTIESRLPCLLIYTEAGWLDFVESMQARFRTQQELMTWQRNISPFIFRCDIGNDGRILIVEQQIEHAHLGESCIFIGKGDHLELWDSLEFECRAQHDIRPCVAI